MERFGDAPERFRAYERIFNRPDQAGEDMHEHDHDSGAFDDAMKQEVE